MEGPTRLRPPDASGPRDLPASASGRGDVGTSARASRGGPPSERGEGRQPPRESGGSGLSDPHSDPLAEGRLLGPGRVSAVAGAAVSRVRGGVPDSRSRPVPSVLHAGGAAQVQGEGPGASPASPARSEGPAERILVASMFSAPVPCARTFAATVPASGLRATTIGSHAGLSAVPHPCHFAASGVAGAVSTRGAPPSHASSFITPRSVDDSRPAYRPGPTTSRSAPAALSMALLTSSDFGKPDP